MSDKFGQWISIEDRLPEPEIDVLCAGPFQAPLFASTRTLINWHRDKPELFATVLAGAVVIKEAG